MTKLVKKFNGEVEPFDSQKLINSLIRAGATPDIARTITDSVSSVLPELVSTAYIHREAFRRLKKVKVYQPVIKYSLKQSIRALGPTGFPFEQFVGEIMKAEGYDVKTNLLVKGKCAVHEVDIAMVKEGVLTSIEAKFHSDYTYNTDLKTVLYVRARIDDIKDTEIEINGGRYKTQNGMVVTNTKFSDAALGYAECAGLKILGWNNPEGNTLHELIQRHKLYPITVLNSLSNTEKKELILSGIITCKQLKESGNQKALKELELIC